MTNLIFLLNLLFTSCSETPTRNTVNEAVQNDSIVQGDTVNQPGKNIMVIYQDSKNNYWFGSWKTGIYRYDGKTIIHYTSKHGLPGNRVEEIKEDRFGTILINTNAGLAAFKGTKIISIPESLILNSKWDLKPDDLWFKSPKSGYVYRYSGESLNNLKIPTCKVGDEYLAQHPNEFGAYNIYCIYNDSKGNVWFGTALLGAFRYNGKSFDWISEPDLTELHNGPANGIRSIAEDKNGEFWFNTGYRYQIYNRHISSSTDTSGQHFYTRLKSIGYLDGKTEGDLNEYLSIIKDNKNNLWMATYLQGVWMFDGEKIKHYPVQVNDKNIPIHCLYNDHHGNIWLGTDEHGIFKFNGQTFDQFEP